MREDFEERVRLGPCRCDRAYIHKTAIERMRDAVVFVQQVDASVAIQTELTAAIELRIQQLSQQYNNGQAFPARSEHRLRPGRRPKFRTRGEP